jgi:Txe/YoeB family toxin of Txe-Axe toxin-antitoxin module
VKVYWQKRALKDYQGWAETDPVILETINDLIEDIKRYGLKSPKMGGGQPKKLKRELRVGGHVKSLRKNIGSSTASSVRAVANRS